MSLSRGGLIMKERIMQAFIEEIHHKGMKFTMDDLAKRLGISKRTLYEHFSSKVEILDTIITQTLQDFDQKTEAIVNNENLSLVDKIKRVITVIPEYNDFYDLCIIEQMKRYYPAQWEQLNVALNQWDSLRELIKQGIEEGIIVNRNFDLMMKVIIDAVNSTLDRSFFLENRLTVSDALDTIVDMLLHGLLTSKVKSEL